MRSIVSYKKIGKVWLVYTIVKNKEGYLLHTLGEYTKQAEAIKQMKLQQWIAKLTEKELDTIKRGIR